MVAALLVGVPAAGATVVGGSPTLASYKALVLADSPVGYWALDEDNVGSGQTVAADSSGNGRNGTIGTAVTSALGGPFGSDQRVFNMNNTSNCAVNLNAWFSALSLSTFSVEAWFKTTNPSPQYLFRVRTNGYDLTAGPSGALGGWESPSSNKATAGTSTVTDGAWHHVVGTRDTSQWKVYVDGALEGAVGAAGNVYFSGNEVAIGRDGSVCGNAPFVGQMSNVAVYNYGLSAARIRAHSAARSGWIRLVSQMFGSTPSSGSASDPVNTAIGNFHGSWTDLAASSNVFGMDVRRSYNSLDVADTTLSRGWRTSFTQTIEAAPNGAKTLTLEDGRQVIFVPSGGGWVQPIEFNGSLGTDPDGSFKVTFPDETVWSFDLAGRLEQMASWDDQMVTLVRNTAGDVVTATSSLGPVLTFAYQSFGTPAKARLVSVTSSDGRSVGYGFNTSAQMVSFTDAAGKVTTMVPDVTGTVKKLIDPTGVVLVDNTFDSLGRVQSQVTPTGTVTFNYLADFKTDVALTTPAGPETVRYTHDSLGRLISQQDPFTNSAAKSYDPLTGWLASGSTRSGQTVLSHFDANGNPESVTDPATGATTYTYTPAPVGPLDPPAGLVRTMTSPASGTTTFVYQPGERVPTTITDQLSKTTTNDVDSVTGLVLSTTDADGVKMTFGYDALRRIHTATDLLGRQTVFDYDSAGRMNRVETPEHRVTLSNFDGLGRTLTQTANDTGLVTTTYDDAGRVLTVKDQIDAITRNTYYPTTGLLWKVEKPGDVAGTFKPPTVLTYDVLGQLTRVTDPTGVFTETTYNTFGRVSSKKDTAGRVTSFQYDANGQVRKVIAPDLGERTVSRKASTDQIEIATDELLRKTLYEYKPNGQVDKITTAQGTAQAATTTFHYDGLGRRDQTTDQLGRVTRAEFTAAGRVFKQFDAANNATIYHYDAAGQNDTITDSATPTPGVRLMTYWGDGQLKSDRSPNLQTTSYTYDVVGRLASVTDPAGVVNSRTYTLRGELATESTTGLGSTLYVYNRDGTMKSSRDRLLATTSYFYDSAGRMTLRTTPVGTETLAYNPTTGELTTFTPPAVANQPVGATSYTYDTAGRVKTVTDGSGRVQTNNWDTAGQLQDTTFANGAQSLFYDYNYNNAGRMSTLVAPEGTYLRGYNQVGQLTVDAKPDGRITTWGYDAAGRRSTMTTPDGTALSYGYDTMNRVNTINPVSTMADTFTQPAGTTGLDPAKWKWVTPTAGGSIAAQQSFVRFSTPNSVSSGAVMSANTPVAANQDISFDYKAADTTAANQAIFRLRVRSNFAANNEYQVKFPTDSTTATISKVVAGTTTAIGTFALPPTSVRKKVRISLIGTQISAKAWDATATEPTAWGTQLTDAAVTVAGETSLQMYRQVGGPNNVDVDNYVQTNNPGTAQPAIATYVYNADSQVTTETLPSATRTWSYTLGRPTQLVHTKPSAATETSTLSYTSSGRINVLNSPSAGPARVNTYNAAGELATWQPLNGNTTTYGYDAAGRRSTTAVAGVTTTNTYDARSQLTQATPTTSTPTTFTYDGAGRRLTETTGTTTNTYGYDPAGRQTTVANQTGATVNSTETRTLTPDGLVAGVTKQVGSTTTSTSVDWDINKAVPDMTTWNSPTSGANNTTVLVDGPTTWAATLKGSTATPVVSDILGSTIAATGQTANNATSYDPFGVPTGQSGTTTPKLGYRGELTIGNLTNLRARNYDPTRGKFTTTDPLPDVPGTPSNGDPYHYTNNDPLNMIDRLGLQGCPAGGQTDVSYQVSPSTSSSGSQGALISQFDGTTSPCAPNPIPTNWSMAQNGLSWVVGALVTGVILAACLPVDVTIVVGDIPGVLACNAGAFTVGGTTQRWLDADPETHPLSFWDQLRDGTFGAAFGGLGLVGRGYATTADAVVATNSVADDLAIAESHLGSIDAMTPPNRMMLERIAEAQQSGRALTSGEQNFLTHETTEAGLRAQGLGQDAAHAGALETHPLYGNYDPEVIKAFPEYFNSNWRKFWGIK